MGNVGARFEKPQTQFAKLMKNDQSQTSRTRDTTFLFLPLFSLWKPLPMMQDFHCVTSLEASHKITRSFLWSDKRLYTNVVLYTMYTVVLPKTWKHTSMCNIGGVTPLRSVVNDYVVCYWCMHTCKYISEHSEAQEGRETERSTWKDFLTAVSSSFFTQDVGWICQDQNQNSVWSSTLTLCFFLFVMWAQSVFHWTRSVGNKHICIKV